MLRFPKKEIFIVILAVILFSLFFPSISSGIEENEGIEMHYFYKEGCSFCASQSEFIEENLKGEYPNLEIHKHNFAEENSIDLLNQLAKERGIDPDDLYYVAPTTFIDNRIFQGFSQPQAKNMIDVIENRRIENRRGERDVIDIPIIGQVNPENIPLPLLAMGLGSIDGMNVCSIGALVMVLLIVLSFDSRKKIFFYGFLFIFTVILVYGLFVFAWYHLLGAVISHLDFLSYIIGFAGIIGGIFFFEQFIEYYRYGPQCSYENSGYLTKARRKVKESFESKSSIIALSGSIIFFAAVVTLIELPCSASFPLVFSGVLVDAQLPGLTHVLYILLYLLFYMLVELIIFTGAVITKEVWVGNGKFVTWVTLFGSILLFVLGGYYLI